MEMLLFKAYCSDMEVQSELVSSSTKKKMSMSQVPVKFVTQHAQYAVPAASILVPIDLRRIALSEIVNHLRGADRPIPFDFYVNGALLKGSLQDFLLSQGITSVYFMELDWIFRYFI